MTAPGRQAGERNCSLKRVIFCLLQYSCNSCKNLFDCTVENLMECVFDKKRCFMQCETNVSTFFLASMISMVFNRINSRTEFSISTSIHLCPFPIRPSEFRSLSYHPSPFISISPICTHRITFPTAKYTEIPSAIKTAHRSLNHPPTRTIKFFFYWNFSNKYR